MFQIPHWPLLDSRKDLPRYWDRWDCQQGGELAASHRGAAECNIWGVHWWWQWQWSRWAWRPFLEHSVVPGREGDGCHHRGSVWGGEAEAGSVHRQHPHPRVQDGAVLHGLHGGPHSHTPPQARMLHSCISKHHIIIVTGKYCVENISIQETGHGQAAPDPEDPHHQQAAGEHCDVDARTFYRNCTFINNNKTSIKEEFLNTMCILY